VTRQIFVEVGQLVLLKNHRKPEEGQSAQLLPLWEGPFRVVKQEGPVNFRLVHLSNHKRTELAHVDRLKPFLGREEDQPLEKDEYEVEDIIDMKQEGGTNKYLVRWKGFTAKDDTWQTEASLASAPEILRRFKEKNNGRKEERAGAPAAQDDDSGDEEEEEEGDDLDITIEYPPDLPPPNIAPQPPARPDRSTAGQVPARYRDYVRH
jgi:hypothetical protein